MTTKIYGNHFENCSTGISAPKDANLEIGSNKFVACGKAVDLRDPPSLMRALGLEGDTPVPVLREVLEYLATGQRSEAEVKAKVESVGLFKWLSAGADASTLASAVLSLHPYIPTILGVFGK